MKQNILIVDDDKDICLTLSKILNSKGFQVTIANNSDEAISEIKGSSIDLVLFPVQSMSTPSANGSKEPACPTFTGLI